MKTIPPYLTCAKFVKKNMIKPFHFHVSLKTDKSQNVSLSSTAVKCSFTFPGNMLYHFSNYETGMITTEERLSYND